MTRGSSPLRPTDYSPAISAGLSEPALVFTPPASRPPSTTACSLRPRPPCSSSAPIGSCSPPATPPPGWRARRRAFTGLARAFLSPAPAPSLSRTGRSATTPRRHHHRRLFAAGNGEGHRPHRGAPRGDHRRHGQYRRPHACPSFGLGAVRRRRRGWHLALQRRAEEHNAESGRGILKDDLDAVAERDRLHHGKPPAHDPGPTPSPRRGRSGRRRGRGCQRRGPALNR